jgi:peptidoglycan hydrolase-like protein with peptidoglycan-binding domain
VLDRYGKIFDDSKATVGGVKTAGADIPAPQATVESAIDDIASARTDLSQAQQELTEAQASLASARAAASSTPTSPATEPPPTTTTTIVPETTVSRIKKAEADFKKAMAGITDQTPVAEAGVAFNSAAFALEAAWLQLLAQAGCISDEQRAQAITKVQEYTVALQKELQTAGYYKGAPDGLYGPETVDAVKQLQTDSSLPATGLVDQATALALDKKVQAAGTANTADSLVQISALQAVLKVAGYWTGPVDGKWTPELTAALKELQTALGVPATGVVDPATLGAVETAVSKAKASTVTTTTTTTVG